MKFLVALPMMAFASLAAAAPLELQERGTTMCGQWDSTQAGPTTLFNNLWGRGSASSGSECTTFNYANGNSISWSTSWSWAGGHGQVKSYPNARIVVNKAVSAIGSLPSIWKWSYSGNGVVADVAYDMFTGDSASSAHRYEIMVWLGRLGGAGPISSTGNAIDAPHVGGVAFQLFKGQNGQTTVYSFVAKEQQNQYQGDIKEFFHYLMSKQGFSGSQVLQNIGAGTEPFEGSNAVFSTSQYSIEVK